MFSIPPRPEGLSPKMIDLTDSYTESFFLPGIKLPKNHRAFAWCRIPEELQSTGSHQWDARGVIQLNSASFPANSGNRTNKNLNDFLPNPCPDQVSIQIGQRFETIHFLQSCRWGNKGISGQEVASYILHYEDGTTAEPISVIYGENIFNNANGSLEDVSLAPDTQIALSMPCMGENGGEYKIVFTSQSCPNPYPDKLVTHLDFISGKKHTALCWPESRWNKKFARAGVVSRWITQVRRNNPSATPHENHLPNPRPPPLFCSSRRRRAVRALYPHRGRRWRRGRDCRDHGLPGRRDGSECLVDARQHRGWRDKLRNAIQCHVSGVAARCRTELRSVIAAPSRLTSSSRFGRHFALSQRHSAQTPVRTRLALGDGEGWL